MILGAGLLLWGCGPVRSTNAAAPQAPEKTNLASLSGDSAAADKPSPTGPPAKRSIFGSVGASNKVSAAPVTPAMPATVTIPAGAKLRIRTTSAISTKTATSGERYAATLETPLAVGGTIVATKGADALLRVVQSEPGGRVKGRANMTVQLAQIRGADGRLMNVQTTSVTRWAPATKKRDMVKVGVVSGVGAVIGAIAGGGKGAAIGAGSGAGAGTAYVLATRGAPAVIPAESVLTFQLNAPITAGTPR